MGEGSARASSIVCPVSATIQTCLNAAGPGVADESPEAGALPLPEPESPDVELSGVELLGDELSGEELAGVEGAAVEPSGVEAGAEVPAGGEGLGCAGAGVGVGCAAGAPAGGGAATTIVGRRVAEASVASAWGPAAAPAATPKPSM